MLKFEKKMTALIMIGGQSRRMGGGIKSFIKFNNKTIFDRILERTKPQIKKIIINCNQHEEEICKYKLPIIPDLKKGFLGPLAGIHSAMSWININDPQVEWLITLPGDTPFIPENLIDNFEKKISPESKKILAKSDNNVHPIIGAWHMRLLKNLNSNLNEGVRKIMSWAKLHHIEYTDYSSIKYDPFFNINTKDDIQLAIQIEKNFIEKNE